MTDFKRGDIVKFHGERMGVILCYGAKVDFTPNKALVVTPDAEEGDRVLLAASEMTLVDVGVTVDGAVVQEVLAKLGQLWLEGWA